MISSEDAINYDELTELTENILKYFVEPAIKKSAKSGNRQVKLLMFDRFSNISFWEQIFNTDNVLKHKHLSVFDCCYQNELLFYHGNKSLIQYRLNLAISSLGYNVIFNDVQNDKINDGFSIILTW